MLRGQRKMLGVLLCHALSYYFDTVSLTDPESKLMAAKPSDPPVSTSPSALEFQTCAWPCLTLHMSSGTQTQTFTLCNKHSYPLLSISPATIFFSVLGSIIHFWTAENSEVRTLLVKISPLSGSRSVIMMCWRKSFGHMYRILYMETNTRSSESLTHFFSLICQHASHPHFYPWQKSQHWLCHQWLRHHQAFSLSPWDAQFILYVLQCWVLHY